MKTRTAEGRGRAELPSGRLLYKAVDELRYVLAHSSRTGDLWLVEDGWTAESEATGPFHPGDVLRAFRLANTMVADGCELGPWQWGIGLFKRSKLPSHPNDWARVEPALLAPSVSRYTGSDIDEVVNEACCAPSRDPPRIEWRGDGSAAEAARLREVVRARYRELRLEQVGALRRAWNAHPAGSPVLAKTRMSSGTFAIVDLPPAWT